MALGSAADPEELNDIAERLAERINPRPWDDQNRILLKLLLIEFAAALEERSDSGQA
jgi:hypothetical protein